MGLTSTARRDLTPRAWFADSDFYGWQRNDGWPDLADAMLDTATDAELARWLNLLGWPVAPGPVALGPWTGGTHWP